MQRSLILAYTVPTTKLRHAPLNRDEGSLLLDAYLTPRQKTGQLIREHIKGTLAAAIRSPLIKALDRSVETWGLRIVTSRLHSSYL